MTSGLFTKILRQSQQEKTMSGKVRDAQKWFVNQAKTLTELTNSQIQKDGAKFVTDWQKLSVGSMYMYYYDAKWKEELPYWDRFPCIFMVAKMPDHADGPRWHGLNLHYLPYTYRALLMDALDNVQNVKKTNSKYDAYTRLKLSYDILKSTKDLAYFKPCFKEYLPSHVHSKFIRVHPSDWQSAMMLPFYDFAKYRNGRTYYISPLTVWKDSMGKIRKG
jgi:hypothetical protein